MLKSLAALVAAAAVAPVQAPTPQGQTIAEALDWYCAGWVRRGAPDQPQGRHDEGARAGWRELASASPAVGPILSKGGDWGRASLVRVVQPTGHRCSITLQLSRNGWTTDIAHGAVTAWVARNWPDAFKARDRAQGPRATRETVWNVEETLSLTLQESPSSGAQPNVFITLARQDRRGNAI